VIGIMSGSSLDGLDLAHCRFDHVAGKIEWSILDARIIPFSTSWKNRLQSAHALNGFDLLQLDAEFGMFIGEAVKNWMKENNFTVDLIASHGHTVFHEPEHHFTTQIGSGAHIAAISGVDTIVDFRQADIANGGQGAPFAPVADRDLFSGYDGYLNLGGIANISIVNPDQTWNAWDIGPCNQALNFLAAKNGFPYDAEGRMAASGKIIPEIVHALKNYFPPTSGRAFSLSNAAVQRTWLDDLQHSPSPLLDLLASTSEAIAQMIIDHIAVKRKTSAKVLVTGGGAHNSFLLQRLNDIGADHSFVFEKPVALIIDFKESLLMAYLGHLSLHGKPFGIHTVTGAARDSIGGAYHKALK
jgi:anhydro-N-acetylmuramic acid kinase